MPCHPEVSRDAIFENDQASIKISRGEIEKDNDRTANLSRHMKAAQ